MSTKFHWQPKMDKSYLIDDLNDWVAGYGGNKIEYDTAMTRHEIESITHAFYELDKKLRQVAR